LKLLLDENLSPRLVDLLSDVYPGSAHVEDLGLGEADDALVWSHAKANGFTIVSKDSDFADISLLQGTPPKVIWIRLGNCTTSVIEMLLRKSAPSILKFANGEETCLVLGRR